MFCRNCGKEIDDNSAVCMYCGTPTGLATPQQPQQPVQPQQHQQPAAQSNTMALVGFILSFFMSLLGLIFSIIGYKNSKLPEYEGPNNYRGLALAGIIISSISMGVYVILFISLIAAGSCAALLAY